MTFLITLLLPLLALADSFTGKVIAVTDGDTVKVLREGNVQEKIRLLGIDAPEKKQAFGPQSKDALSRKVFGKVVTVEFQKRDQYGRTLGKLILDGKDVNLTQVEEGLAWHYAHYKKQQLAGDADLYAAAQEKASGAKVGLWAKAEPTPPWDYRRERKMASRKKRERTRKAHSWSDALSY